MFEYENLTQIKGLINCSYQTISYIKLSNISLTQLITLLRWQQTINYSREASVEVLKLSNLMAVKPYGDLQGETFFAS